LLQVKRLEQRKLTIEINKYRGYFTIAAPQNSNPLTIKWDSINKNLFIFDGSALFETPLAIE